MARDNYTACSGRESISISTIRTGPVFPLRRPWMDFLASRSSPVGTQPIAGRTTGDSGRSAITAASGRPRFMTGCPTRWPSAKFASSTARRAKAGKLGHQYAGSRRVHGQDVPNAKGSNTTNDAFDHTFECDQTIPTSDPMHCTQDRSDANIGLRHAAGHPGGVNVVMADGAAGFVSNAIDIGVWQALEPSMATTP